MKETETLIRQALLKQADRAPGAGPLLARLETAKPKPRYRVLPMVIAVGAVAAVAIAVPVTINSVQRSAPPADDAVTGPGLPLVYSPGWLPKGYVPKSRTVGSGYSSQLFTNGPVTTEDPADFIDSEPKGRTVQLTFAHPTGSFEGVREAIQSNSDKVSINGRTGVFNDVDSDESKLVWMPAPNKVLLVSVSGTPNPRDIAMRVANSVREAPDAGLHPVLRPGSFPRGTEEGILTVSGNSPADLTASAGIARRPLSGDPDNTASMTLTRQNPGLPGGTPFDEHGVRGSYLAPDARGTDPATGKPLGFGSAKLLTRVAGGWWLLIDAPERVIGDGDLAPTVFGKRELIMMAKQAKVDADTAQDWIGRG